MNTLSVTDCIRHYDYVSRHLSPDRLVHSHDTAAVACRLAVRFGIPENLACIAALWHDYARDWPDDLILNTVSASALFRPQAGEYRHPMLLHGAAAAIVLHGQHPYLPGEVFPAVRWHTTGSPLMGRLGYVLYIADYIEKGRRHISSSEKERIESLPTLEAMMLDIIHSSLTFLKDKQVPPAPSTLELLQFLNDEGLC